MKPSVIFIDEVDSLLKSRCDNEHEASRRMKTEFLSQFDGLASEANEGILMIGTTNRPEELDNAARRRFEVKLLISLPEKAARKQMLINTLRNEKYHLSDQELDEIADRTECFSGSDIVNLCKEAANFPLDDLTNNVSFNSCNLEDLRGICYNDFLLALNRVKPCFSKEELDKFEQWNKQYGTCY